MQHYFHIMFSNQLFIAMKNVWWITLLTFCLLFNSCILHWGQRWEYYDLGYQVQQKRYSFNISLQQNWGNFYELRATVFTFWHVPNICDRFTFPHRWLLQTGQADQWRSQQSRDKPLGQSKEKTERCTRHGPQCGEFLQWLAFFQQYYNVEEADFLRCMLNLQDTLQSVTVVLFHDQHTLISSGAVDG